MNEVERHGEYKLQMYVMKYDFPHHDACQDATSYLRVNCLYRIVSLLLLLLIVIPLVPTTHKK